MKAIGVMTFGGYVIQLAKADGLTVIEDASRSDQTLVHSLGADYVLDRGDPFGEGIAWMRVLIDRANGTPASSGLDFSL